jgi:hypothetical protein
MASREGAAAPVNVGLIAGVNQSNFCDGRMRKTLRARGLHTQHTLKASARSHARATRRKSAALAASVIRATSATPVAAGTTTRRDCVKTSEKRTKDDHKSTGSAARK